MWVVYENGSSARVQFCLRCLVITCYDGLKLGVLDSTMGAYVCYTNIPLQTNRLTNRCRQTAMEADFFFGPKKFCRLREALEELDNAEEADNDVD